VSLSGRCILDESFVGRAARPSIKTSYSGLQLEMLKLCNILLHRRRPGDVCRDTRNYEITASAAGFQKDRQTGLSAASPASLPCHHLSFITRNCSSPLTRISPPAFCCGDGSGHVYCVALVGRSTYCQVRLRRPPVARLVSMPVCAASRRNLVRKAG